MSSDAYTGTENLEVMKEAVNYNRMLIDVVKRHARRGERVLDFGAGVGTFALPMQRDGYAVECVELDDAQRATLAAQGLTVHRTLEGIRRSLEYAERHDVVLCMVNHYKDGTWRYPEFAQPEDIFLEIIEQIDSPYFGVQYDPSNAFVGGFDPVKFLEKVRHRVVTMHASDRYLAPGATLADLATGDGATGYASALKHGETGKGLNDYDAIFRLLADVGFSGWISVEAGLNGLEEIARSVEFLKHKRAEHFGLTG